MRIRRWIIRFLPFGGWERIPDPLPYAVSFGVTDDPF